MNFPSKLCIALSFAALVGCGGGGSSSPDPVTSANNNVAPPISSKLTITGAVTDDPIDSATVSFRVGDREFQATRGSDVSGGFSVDIEYDSLDDLVYGQALRNASGIHFMGDVMTVRDLLSQARDGTVAGARITNVTTAKFVLAQQSTNDGVIDSYAEFSQASDGVDPQVLLNVGASIKAVVEQIDGATLPSHLLTTLDLAEGIANGSSTFIEDLAITSPGTLAAAIEKLLNDGYATLDFAEQSVPGVYMSTTSLKAFALFRDGSGLVNTFDDSDIARVRDWMVNADGDLELVYASGDAKRDVLQQLSATGDSLSINQRRLDQGDAIGTVDVANFQFFRFGARFDAATVAGTYANTNDSGSDFVLNVGGSGYFVDAHGTVAGNLSWAVAGDGRLVMNIGGGQTTTLSLLQDAAGELRVLALGTRASGAVQNMVIQTFAKS